MRTSRRGFLKTLGGVALFSIVPRHVLGNGYIAPSDQLTKGIIGTGGMGRGHVNYAGTRLVAVCDVDKNHLELGKKLVKEKIAAYHDFRDLILDPNTWFRFTDQFYGLGTPVKPLKKLVQSGLLGWPLKVTISAHTGFNWKFFWVGKEYLEPQPVPAELDYDMWLGPAPYKPYNPHRVHQTFRGYWDYDGGGLGDMGQHYIDPVQYILGKDDTSPIKVEVDAPQQHPDAVGTWRSITYTYDDGCQIVLWGGDFGDPNTPYIAGPKGNVYKNFVCDIPDWERKLADFPEPEPQVTDFIECVKTRQPFALNEKNGFRSATIVNMGAVALRLNRTLNFDPVKLEFIDDEAANRLLDQPMRAPWNI